VTDDAEPASLQRLRDAVRRIAEVTAGRPPTGLGHDDAPDDVGTIGTDDAVGFDPLGLLARLDAAGARVVVMGQVAGILHGSVELTGDLDLLWDGEPGQAAALAAGFAAVGADLVDDDNRPVPCTAESFTLPKVQFRSPAASGDCCTPRLPWGDLPVGDFVERALTVTTAGHTVRYLGLADLVAMRRAAGRPKDLRRAAELMTSPSRRPRRASGR
jgi:hypothetical protein